MFSGIVETTATIEECIERDGVLECTVQRPPEFQDLKRGDSIATDGVCLTIQKFSEQTLTFALGPETLKVTGWDQKSLLRKPVNLERSLRLNDRIHGHLVTGHVDTVGKILEAKAEGETLKLTVEIPVRLAPYIWSKGSVAINGVSLTINDVGTNQFQVWLIPETLKRTNLGQLKSGDPVNLEIDNMARGLVHALQRMKELGP